MTTSLIPSINNNKKKTLIMNYSQSALEIRNFVFLLFKFNFLLAVEVKITRYIKNLKSRAFRDFSGRSSFLLFNIWVKN